MNQNGWVWFCAILILICNTGTTADFVSLFDGKTLNGWHIEGTEDPAAFIVNPASPAIMTPGKTNFPTWLRSDKEYENFDLRFEYLYHGWCNSGVFFRAPKHGRNAKAGFEFQIDQIMDEGLLPKTSGGIFGVLPPIRMAQREEGVWNQARILAKGPHLTFWINGQVVQDVNVDHHEELRYRLRKGYIGLQSLGYPAWFRHIQIKELPSTDTGWVDLFNGNDLSGWYTEGEGAVFTAKEGVIHAEGNGSYLITQDTYEDFELQTYVRTSPHANGGIFIRWNTLAGRDRGNEIQIENIPDSNYTTGSLYNVARAEQPHYRDGEWFLMQVRVEGSQCIIRVNGETVVNTHNVSIIRPGHISLQMHKDGAWIEWKDIRIKRL